MLEDDKVYLVPIEYDDTDMIVKWRNQSFVRNKFIFRELFTREIHEHWMKTMVDTGNVKQFIIYVKEGKQPVGTVYLRDIDKKNMRAEYGIFIGEEKFIGKGIGSRSARLIIKYAFEELCLHKVMLKVFAKNEIAIESYKKAGFKTEGYFKDEVKIDGNYHDLIYMAVINSSD